jgi:hypothetical protein
MFPFLLAFIAGFLVKWVDWLDDDKKSKGPAKYALAVLYGLLIGYLIGTSSFAVLFLAALVAQVFARKVDTTAHRIGFISSAVAMVVFGFPLIDAAPFAFFLMLAFLDEADYIGWLRPLADHRPFLKLGGLVMLATGRWDYFAAIMLFDIGYLMFHALVRPAQVGSKNRKTPKPPSPGKRRSQARN